MDPILAARLARARQQNAATGRVDIVEKAKAMELTTADSTPVMTLQPAASSEPVTAARAPPAPALALQRVPQSPRAAGSESDGRLDNGQLALQRPSGGPVEPMYSEMYSSVASPQQPVQIIAPRPQADLAEFMDDDSLDEEEVADGPVAASALAPAAAAPMSTPSLPPAASVPPPSASVPLGEADGVPDEDAMASLPVLPSEEAPPSAAARQPQAPPSAAPRMWDPHPRVLAAVELQSLHELPPNRLVLQGLSPEAVRTPWPPVLTAR
jgi:hypothetical protein